jgi:hypothetical protein
MSIPPLERKLRYEKMLNILNLLTESSLLWKIWHPNNLQNIIFLNLWVTVSPTKVVT